MTRYLISFDDGAMNGIPEEDFPEVAKAAHAVITEARWRVGFRRRTG